MEQSQIYLVTPRHIDLDSFPAQLEAAMNGGPIAALLIDCDEQQDSELQKIAQTIAPMAQKNDIAVVLRGDTRIAGRAKCDGLHINGDINDIELAVEDFSERFMLGAEGGNKRHIAMEIAETGIDYIMFGRLNAPTEEKIYDKALEMADWWSSLFEVPAVIIGGSDLSECETISSLGIEFIALREAIWDHEQGPEAAVREASALIAAGAPQEAV
ncbi:thiamine-phosphate pyrophosphorylase [Cohaesibacter sp. ES.047]|uniref:thiamine phosphate synthase n=1 Tax=Cohaesibacter sp. ES.047 TaxID=1798205 RepID=UPI000BB69BC5|nr:thiamine phosphate synthase [Cohaesibacter sp. ES.047]SNY90965.1 thiamine-phosphate pyrophosphorylase [Cohaesibacter sp. ES.047]